jgi:fucose 4-O-acetylase-like acetyltransferase
MDNRGETSQPTDLRDGGTGSGEVTRLEGGNDVDKSFGADQAAKPGRAARDREVEGARQEKTARVESLDIIRAVLIICVVYAHLVEHFATHSPIFQAVYSALSVFGLPLFVMISGILAKPLLGDMDYRKMFAKLVLPLICLQPFYLLLYWRTGANPVRVILDPQWLLWFLLSLCLWRMMLPLFLRIPMALVVAVGITLAAGYAQYIGGDLSLGRTLYFFPFFLAAYLWRDRLPRLVDRARLLWALVFILLMAGVMLWSLHGLDPAVVYAALGYEKATVWKSFPALGRLGFLLMSALGALSWWAIMPRKSKWLVRLGRRTLTILALHGFVVLVCLKLFNMAGWTASPSLALFPVLLVIAVAIAWAVSLLDGPFNRFFDWLAERLWHLSQFRERSRAHSA